jgi:hypothetical protein
VGIYHRPLFGWGHLEWLFNLKTVIVERKETKSMQDWWKDEQQLL